jgi:hypothetical protein
LQRQHDEEGGRQCQVIAASGAGQGQEFAQGRKRGDGKESDHSRLAESEGEADQRDHHPPRFDPGVKIADDRTFGKAMGQCETD